MHQIPDRAIVETLHTQTPLKLLDRDLACETVISAVKADPRSVTYWIRSATLARNARLANEEPAQRRHSPIR
jgi:hypothetical protein